MADFPDYSAFLADVLAWCRNGTEASLIRALRSPHSGVPHDIAAAYAVVAGHAGPLLDAITRERLALPTQEREAVFAFQQRIRSIERLAQETTDDRAVAERARELFAPVRSESEVEIFASSGLRLAEPLGPDERSGVVARQKHFSASALNAYVECARKWFYRYVCAAIEDTGSSASTYGTAFHTALEDFHGEFPHPDATVEREMRNKIASYVAWAFERHRAEFDTAVEVELQKRRALRTAQRYVDWLISEAKRAPFTVVGREQAVNLQLDEFAFVGFIDRLDRDDRSGAISIFDYKTGTIATSAAEYREKVAQFRDFQLPFYYWAQTELGERVSRLALIPLKDALLDVRPVALEIVPLAPPERRKSDAPVGTLPIAELERARTRMIEIARELTSGELEAFPVTTDPSACTYCAYVTACANRPMGERERFGR